MKSIRLFTFIFLLCSGTAGLYSQPTTQWIARLNGLLDSTDVAKDITVDNFGNSYVTGYSYYLLGLLTDALTVSYDSNGNERWRAKYGGLLCDEGTAITLDNTQQYVYITGFTDGLLNLTAADYFIVKYEAATGDTVWSRRYNYGLLGDDRATSIAVDGQNNPIITGYSQGFLIMLTPYDYATVKYDQNGNQQWASRYNGTGSNQDRAYAIIVDGSDNVIVTGESYGSSSNYDYATVKYNSNGSQQWASRYNGTANDTDRAYAIIVDGSDNIIVTGDSKGSGTSFDYATVKYNQSGGQNWVQRYDGTGNNEDRAYAIIVDGSDNVYVTGSSRSSNTAGSEDYATLKYTPSGGQTWVTRYDGTGNNEDRAYAIIVDGSDNVYITGSSRNGSLLGSEDYLTIKYAPETNPVIIISNQVPVKNSLWQNYPNPFNPKTQINFDIASQSNVKVSIYNILGDEVAVLLNDMLNPGSYAVKWDASRFSSGIYFYRISVGDFTDTKKLILAK